MFYDEEKYSYSMDKYRKYSREPDVGEKEFFRSVSEEVVSDTANLMNSSIDFRLYFAATDQDALSDDLSINRFVHGFSFAEWMKDIDNNVIILRFNDRQN